VPVSGVHLPGSRRQSGDVRRPGFRHAASVNDIRLSPAGDPTSGRDPRSWHRADTAPGSAPQIRSPWSRLRQLAEARRKSVVKHRHLAIRLLCSSVAKSRNKHLWCELYDAQANL
jgi:hypothetical protein